MAIVHHLDSWWSDVQEIAGSAPEGASVAVSIHDVQAGLTRDIDGNRGFAAASTIKVLVLAAMAQAFDEGVLDPGDMLAVPASARCGGSGVLNWLAPELQLSLRDHAWLMTAISDNSASNVCIDAAGMASINQLGVRLGAVGTRLGRHFLGLPVPTGSPDNRATANGLVAILDAIEGNTAASAEQCAWMRQCLDAQQHRDALARHLPADVHFRGKSGSLGSNFHDCGVLAGPRGKVVIAVMTEGFNNPHAAHRLIGRIATVVAAGLTSPA